MAHVVLQAPPSAVPGAEDLERAGRDPKLANVLYHDAAARSYDHKWAISFDRRCIDHVARRASRMLPRRRYDRVLDVGVGTGFFLLNLWQAGFVGRAFGCDLSTGMLAACARSARAIGCDVALRCADAERLPYPDGSFDLVVSHAVLHHLPDPAGALGEWWRVLAPGGALLVAGEPTVRGDRVARGAGRLAWRWVEAARRLAPALRPPDPGPPTGDRLVLAALEWSVDLHTFDPGDVERMARAAGFSDVRVETEELASSVAGWVVRTVEAGAPPGLLGARWAAFAYAMYRALYAVDQAVLYRLLPRSLFYNVLLSARRG